MVQVGKAIELAEGGECVMSAEMWEAVRALRLPFRSSGHFSSASGFQRLDISEHEDERFAHASGTARNELLGRLKMGRISEAGKRKLLGYTPILVHAGVLEEGTGLQSEIRTVTCMFLMIDTAAITVRQAGRRAGRETLT